VHPAVEVILAPIVLVHAHQIRSCFPRSMQSSKIQRAARSSRRACWAWTVVCLVACGADHSEPPRPEPAEPLPVLSPLAPPDRPVELGEDLEIEIERLSRISRGELPGVRERFLGGLPPNHHLFVSTTLHDASANEMVFVHVREWREPELIDGVLDSDVTVTGYRRGQPLSVRTSDVADWTISRPDGTEEGNRIGRYIDAHSGLPVRD
jgi:hypothetical protein